MQNTVFWASLPERNGVANDQVYNAMLDLAMSAGRNGYQRLGPGYSRTDYNRNECCKKFLEASKYDNDLLIMLDADHRYPGNTLERFAANDPQHGVVGALAYRRGEPYDPLFFVRNGGGLYPLFGFDRGPLYQCAIVSTSAISIRRWVLVELTNKGYIAPWFRYEYPTDGSQPSEDMYFGRVCEAAGIWHYCDTGLEIPHSAVAWIDHEAHDAYLALHPEMTTGATVQVGGVG